MASPDLLSSFACLAPHPRLFWTAQEDALLAARLQEDATAALFHAKLLSLAEAHLSDPAPARELRGRRLLQVSRACLRRFCLCAYAFRATEQARFLERVRGDLRAVCAFSDWNPSHFLDVAEMAMGVALAYDWVHEKLSQEDRCLVRAALLAKALAPGTAPGQWWQRAQNNWNQVCHGGLGAAALAIAEDYPEAPAVLARFEASTGAALAGYAPHGAYPEGPGYWSFGTTYSILLMDGLRTALGYRTPTTDAPGFLASGEYMAHVVGPSGSWWQYSDCGGMGKPPEAALAWIAAERQDPALWRDGAGRLAAFAAGKAGGGGSDRFLPLALIWSLRVPAGGAEAGAPLPLSWRGEGTTPVAFHRTAHGADAVWAGIKGGSPASNHSHMDVGAFVVDALGLRWADDLGMQDYHGLESKGVQLFTRVQEEDAPRWSVFRLCAHSHSVLTVDGQGQRLQGTAPITHHSLGRSIVDLGATYAGLLAGARRGIALVAGSVVVRDEVRALEGRGCEVRWAMLTRAEVGLGGEGEGGGEGMARLTRDGKALALRVLSPRGVRLQTFSTQPRAEFDEANPGTTIVGFCLPLSAGEAASLVVALVPGGGEAPQDIPHCLEAWGPGESAPASAAGGGGSV